MNKNVLEISVRADIGGGPKHLLDLLSHNKSNIKLYSAIPYGYEYSNKIQSVSEGSIAIPHRKFSLLSFIRIIKFCKKNEIRTVHSHGRGAGYYSRLMKFFGFKVIHTLHGVHIEKTVTNKIKVAIDRILTPLTDVYICVSNGEKEDAIRYKVANSKKIKVIFNGVKLRRERAPKTKVPQIGMLGRLSYQKGYDLLIPAIEFFCKNNKEIEFNINIAGDGEERENLEKVLSKTVYAKNKINFMGPTSTPIEFLLKQSHFLSFARFEGMPLSVLEAMSIGLPCMVSNVVGNKDLINSRNGLLFSPTDFNQTFHNFIKLDHTETINFSLTDIKQSFDVNKQTLKTLSLYF